GKWERTTWDEALNTIAARIRNAILENRRDEIMYHVGRPGEDGFTERILAAWGIDGHNSHTNICSSGSREGHPADQRTSRIGPLLQSTCTTRDRWQSQRRETDRLRHAPLKHRHSR